jgi:hypothetical protein
LSTLAQPDSNNEQIEIDSLKTTSVDQVASLLLSLSIMIGLAVALLGALYILRTWKERPGTIKIEPELISGRGDHAAGFERDLEPPAAEEVEQLTEPTIDQILQSITDAVTQVSATLDTMANSGNSKGDSRPPGPEGEGDDIVPRFERWELRFSARDAKNYLSQLDFFGIELAAIGAGITSVDYAKNLSGGLDLRKGKAEEEKRLYFINRREGPLLKYERDALNKAKVVTSGRQVLKMIPKELEDKLAVLEKEFAMKRVGPQVSVKQIGKTVFESQPFGKGYHWVVIEQRDRIQLKK